MAVRAADGPAAGFSGRSSALVKRAKAPNTVIQKDEAIQANRMAKRTSMVISRVLKPSTWNTPAIWVTAATVEASTRNRYSQRRGAISGTAAVRGRLKPQGRRRHQAHQQRAHQPGWGPGNQRLRGHDMGAAERRSRL